MSRLAAIALGVTFLAGGLVAPSTQPAAASFSPAPSITDSPVGSDVGYATNLGEVYDTAIGADGTTYAVGDFVTAGAGTGGLAVFTMSDGSLNRQFPNIPGTVRAITQTAGGWFVAVDDGEGGNSGRPNIIRVLANGTIDNSWPAVVVQAGNVRTMSVVDDSLYLGGDFLNVNGQSRPSLAALNTTSGTLSTWAPAPGPGAVRAITADDSAIYVAGDFTNLNGLPGSPSRGSVAAFDRVTLELLSWDPKINSHVYDMELAGSLLYVTGTFGSIDGQPRGRLAAVGTVPSGSAAPTSWNPDLSYYAYSLALDDTILYVGGAFDYVFTNVGQRTTRSRAAAFRIDTGAVTAWNPDIGGGGREVFAVEATSAGVYLGGNFDSVGGQPRVGLALVDGDSGALNAWQPRPGPQYSASQPYHAVESLASDGSKVFVGSSYSHMLTQSRARAAAFDSQGLLTDWNPQFNQPPRTIVIDDSLAYVGGDFTTVNGGTPRNRAAAVRTDDTGTATTWNPNVSGTVRAITLSDDTAYIGGSFTSIGGSTRNNVAAVRIDDAGSLADWDPNADQAVRVITLSGSTAYLGGDFNNVGGVQRYKAASVSVDDTGSLTAWDPSAWGTVNDIEIRDGRAYLGGQFYLVDPNGNTNRAGVAAFDADDTGAIVTEFNARVGCNGCNSLVNALDFVGNNLYVAGGFTSVDQVNTFSGLIAVSPETGARITSWTPSLTTARSNIKPSILSLDSSGTRLYAGGYFTSITVNDQTPPDGSYATWLPGLPIAPAAPTGVSATAGNASASVAWTPGWDGDAPVTRVEFALDDTTTVDDSTTNTSSPYTLSGLTNGTTYTVYVRLVNSAGAGAWSQASTAFTPEAPPNPPAPDSPPGAPTGVTATPGNASATVSWAPPRDAGAAGIYGYVVRAQPGGQTCSTASTSCTITGLTNGTAYTFTVTAWSIQSPGPASIASAPVTPRTIPGAPTGVTATAGVERARITWTPPADDGGSAITGYRVSLSPATGGCVTDGDTSCTIGGLAADQEYAVTVTAINEAGRSTPSVTVTVTPRAQRLILITGSRTGARDAVVAIRGEVKGMDVSQVQPHYRLGRESGFEESRRPAQVVDGAFTWQRTTSKPMTVYVKANGVASNRVVIPAR